MAATSTTRFETSRGRSRRLRLPVATAVLCLATIALVAVPAPPTSAQTTAQTTAETAATTSSTAPGLLAPTCEASPTAIRNGGFEGPVVADAKAAGVDTATVQGWSSGERRITLASSGFEGITAASGRQFLELVDSSSISVHQDLITNPGTTLAWSLSHRAVAGSGTIRVRVGAPGDDGELRATLTDAEAWTRHGGDYVVPADQTITRLTIESDRGASSGNLLDDVSFGSASCLVATASVTPAEPVEVGATVTETVVVRNVGGSPTTDATLAATLPPTMEYVADSATPNGVWNFVPDTVLIRLVGSTGIPGVVLPGEAVIATWRVIATPAAADSTIRSEVTIAATDAFGGPVRTTSNTATSVVRPSADVQLSQSFSPALVAPGAGTTLTFAATNAGPSTAHGLTVAAAIPDGSTIAANSVPVGCLLTARTITCGVGSLAKDDTRTWSVPLTAPSATGVARAMIALSATTPDPSFDNGMSVAALSVGPPAGASLDIAVNRAPVVATAGAITTIVADVTNVGSAATTGPVTVTNGTPEPFVDLFLAAVLPGETQPECVTTTRSCTVGVLEPGMSARVEFRGTIRPETDDGAMVLGSVRATAPGLPTATSETAIAVRALASLSLDEISPTVPDVAAPITKIVTVTNAGPSFAKSTEIFIPIPEKAVVVTRPVNCTPAYGGLVCPLGDLLAGRPVATTFAFSLPSTGAVVTDRATAGTSTPTAAPVVDRTPQRWVADPSIDLSTSMSGLPTRITTGTTVDISVTATNRGPGDAHDVVVALDPARNGLRVIHDESASGDYDAATSHWTIPTLAANTSVTLSLSVEIGRAGTFALATTIAARQPDIDSSGTTAIARFEATGDDVPAASGNGSSWVGWVIGALVVAAIATAATIVIRRRRSSRTSPPRHAS